MTEPILLHTALAEAAKEASESRRHMKDGGETDAVISVLNETLTFLMINGKAAIAREQDDPLWPGTKKFELSKPGDLEYKFCNEQVKYGEASKSGKCRTVSAFYAWMHDARRREARRLWLDPQKPWGLDPVTGDLNIYQGFAIEPHKPDASHSWDHLRDHLYEVIADGNDKHAEYILNWIAYCVQFPHLMPRVVVALLGGEGTGKGILWTMFLKIWGRHGKHLMRPSDLLGNFNDNLKDAIFVFADEAMFAGDRATANILKGMITEDTFTVEPKFVNKYVMPNYKKIVIASNEHWVVPADTDARRYAVFRVSERRKGQKAYFRRIINQMKNGGTQAMLYDLLDRKIGGFDPEVIPNTDELFEQKQLSWDPTTLWWFERLSEGVLKYDDLGKWTGRISRALVQCAVSAKTTSQYEQHALATKIGKSLNKLCPHHHTDQGTDERGKKERYYVFPSLKQCRSDFEMAHRWMRINWETGKLIEKKA
jgi:Family of unknown function (DUF5906)